MGVLEVEEGLLPETEGFLTTLNRDRSAEDWGTSERGTCPQASRVTGESSGAKEALWSSAVRVSVTHLPSQTGGVRSLVGTVP